MPEKKYEIVTPIGRLAYPYLVEPQPNMTNTKEEFHCTIVFDELTDLSDLEQMVADLTAEVYPKGAPANLRSPFHSGAKKADKEGFCETDIYIHPKRNAKFGPPRFRGPTKDMPKEAADFYAGCKVRANISVFYYGPERGGVPGISFGLNHIQFCGDGPRIGHTLADVDEVFGDVEVDEPTLETFG